MFHYFRHSKLHPCFILLFAAAFVASPRVSNVLSLYSRTWLNDETWLIWVPPDWLVACRDAALNGYIQQLLYTYRYFCTSEQLLRFLMDRFIAAARY